MTTDLRIGSLFSGYGGLDIAVQSVFGGSVAWHCEWETAPSKILTHHWPAVPNLHDVTTVDWTSVEPVDILTGGYPCQPFSQAGRRKGTDDERHLWPYVREAIRHLRPRYTVLENVAGHRSMGFDRVLGDLTEDGPHARWVSVRASAVGAPHHRERLFIVVTPADTAHDGRHEQYDRTSSDATCSAGVRVSTGGVGGVPAYPEGERLPGQQLPSGGGAERPEPDVRSALLPDYGRYTTVIRRWEAVTRPAPAPTELNRNGRPRLNAAFAE